MCACSPSEPSWYFSVPSSGRKASKHGQQLITLASVPKHLVTLINVIEGSSTHHAGDMLRSAVIMLHMRRVRRPHHNASCGSRRTRAESRRSRSRMPAGLLVVLHSMLTGKQQSRAWSWHAYDGRLAALVTAAYIYIENRRAATIRVQVVVVNVDIDVDIAVANNTWRGRTVSRKRMRLFAVQIISETPDTIAGEDAEDVTLVVVKLRRSFAAEEEQLVTEEGLHACQAEVGELRAIVEKNMDALNTGLAVRLTRYGE